MKNAISIDLEDWFCVHNLSSVIKKEEWDNCELRIEDSTKRILDLLSRHNTKATFFVLGWIAERVPQLISEIAEEGHEIATHGYSHTLITEMEPNEFEEDLQKAIRVTKEHIDGDIKGFRAPSFTITEETLWAIDILKENGVVYDSSVFPINYHPDYGLPNSSLGIYEINQTLTEVPLTCIEVLGKRLPCSGGGYFRFYPYQLTRYFLKKVNNRGRSINFYLHPWEMDPDQPRVSDLPWTKRARHYHNLKTTEERFDRLLGDFQFNTIMEVLKDNE